MGNQSNVKKYPKITVQRCSPRSSPTYRVMKKIGLKASREAIRIARAHGVPICYLEDGVVKFQK